MSRHVKSPHPVIFLLLPRINLLFTLLHTHRMTDGKMDKSNAICPLNFFKLYFLLLDVELKSEDTHVLDSYSCINIYIIFPFFENKSGFFSFNNCHMITYK